jgi:heme/copper-type cytochrome/quinol oxidase subunit 3
MSIRAYDVSPLPSFGFGNRSVTWWGTLGMIAIEGTVFALAIATYLYVRSRVPDWPPGLSAPWLGWGTAALVVMLVSAVPNMLAKQAADRLDLNATRLWLSVTAVFGIALIVIRVYEFAALNVWWDTNAYGSAVWTLLGLHTVHLATDLGDSLVLIALTFSDTFTPKRFVDLSENAMYWYFVVVSWVPIYGVIYLAPRIL